jgi:hypothetical protein
VTASLELRVDAAEVPAVRRTVMSFGSAVVDIVRVSPVRGSLRVDVVVALRRESLAAVMKAVMDTLDIGETARVKA